MQKKIIIWSVLCFLLTTGLFAQPSIPTSNQQIKAAVMAAPQALQQGAKVYGYDQQGNWTTLREGSNAIICMADDPNQSSFHVACYHKALEPFMDYGRKMRKQGLTRQEVDQKRREAVEAGTFSMPSTASTLYSLSGNKGAYDYETETLGKAQALTVIYVPFGTEETTGMATSPPGPGAPWLMEAGTPWAHIMIPGKPVGKNTESKN